MANRPRPLTDGNSGGAARRSGRLRHEDTAPDVQPPRPYETPLVADQVLLYQRSYGNAWVQRALGAPTGSASGRPPTTSATRAAGVLFRQVPPVYTPPADASAPPAFTLPGTTWLERAENGLKMATPDSVAQAWGILNSSPMYDLLPLLAGLKSRGQWGPVTSEAAFRGGPRMENAVHTVNLKTKGSAITKDELRDLIDRMATMNPDQRRDMLRFVGKNVVITVDGIDLDLSYVAGATTDSATVAVREEIAMQRLFISEYAAALNNPAVKTIADTDRAVIAAMGKQGVSTSRAGSTSSSGRITIVAQPMTKVQPILTRSTQIHEGVHNHRRGELKKRFGKDIAKYEAAWDDAKDYVPDEIKARNTEIAFLKKVLVALNQLEQMAP